MRSFFLLLLSYCLYTHTVLAQGVAVIRGKIKDPVTFSSDGKMIPYGVRFYLESLTESQDFAETVDDAGNFNIAIPLSQAMPVGLEYNYETTSLFLSPNDTVEMNFEASNFAKTLQYKGQGAENCNYLAGFNRRFNMQTEDESLEQKADFVGKQVYANFCEDFRAQQSLFLSEYLRLNKNTTPEFQAWAKAEIKYRAANRMQSFYFASDNKQHDDYRAYAMNYNLNDPESLVSVQYQTLLDNHLRQLSMRDPDDMRAERDRKKQPWVVRGFALAKQQYKGTVLDFANTKLLLNLIEAEYADTKMYYDEWIKSNPNPKYLNMVDKHYHKFVEFLDAPPPVGANLVVVSPQNPMTFDQIIQKYKGKTIFMDFWASWCSPCLSEMPYSTLLHNKLKDKDVVFVYFSSDEGEDKWRANIARYALEGDHYLMNATLQREIYGTLGIQFIPRYVIIDKQGKIINSNAPKPSNPEALKTLNDLL